MAARRRESRGGGVVALMLLGLAVLAGAAYSGLVWYAGDKVPAGAAVAGVGIGGLRTEAAEQRLRGRLAAASVRPIPVTGADLETTLTPADAGLALDVHASVRAAGGGEGWSPVRLWRFYTGGDRTDPVLDVDESALGVAVAGLAEQVDQPAVEGAVVFRDGEAVATQPRDGARVAQDKAREAVRAAYLRATGVQLPVDVLEPDVDASAVEDAMSSFAEPATSGPVRLVLGGRDVLATPRLFTQAVTMEPDDGALVPRLDVDALLSVLEPVLRTVSGTPVPARIVVVGGRPTVVPSKTGVTFDRKDLQRKFLAAAVRRGDRRRAVIAGVSAQPSFTTADARALKVRARVATFTTRYADAGYRNTNLDRGATLVSQTLLLPGATFSFNRAVGRPTAARGFVPGYEIEAGIFRREIGGGLSQLATTAYNAMLLAGLRDVESTITSAYSDRYPKGRVADVSYAGPDLRMRNDSAYGVLLTARVARSSPGREGSVTVEVWSTKRWDVSVTTGREYAVRTPRIVHRKGATCEPSVGYRGFAVDVVRTFRKPGSGAVDHRDRHRARYRPSRTVVCDTP